jgi:hypothetical protein
MGFTHDPDYGIAREGALREYFREPFPNFLKISQHGLSSPAIGPGNENQLRTQMTADRFGLGHKLERCTY